MSLNELLTAMSQDFISKADPDVLSIMKSSREQLEASGLHKQALGAGEKMPDFVLRTSMGEEFSSRTALQKGPLLLCWYRGIW
jgi:hypothetical protein